MMHDAGMMVYIRSDRIGAPGPDGTTVPHGMECRVPKQVSPGLCDGAELRFVCRGEKQGEESESSPSRMPLEVRLSNVIM